MPAKQVFRGTAIPEMPYGQGSDPEWKIMPLGRIGEHLQTAKIKLASVVLRQQLPVYVEAEEIRLADLNILVKIHPVIFIANPLA